MIWKFQQLITFEISVFTIVAYHGFLAGVRAHKSFIDDVLYESELMSQAKVFFIIICIYPQRLAWHE